MEGGEWWKEESGGRRRVVEGGEWWREGSGERTSVSRRVVLRHYRRCSVNVATWVRGEDKTIASCDPVGTF